MPPTVAVGVLPVKLRRALEKQREVDLLKMFVLVTAVNTMECKPKLFSQEFASLLKLESTCKQTLFCPLRAVFV